jgi:hypothetical protein
VSAQADLFEFEARSLPAGMRYWEEAVSEAQERSLVRYIEQLPLQPFEFAGALPAAPFLPRMNACGLLQSSVQWRGSQA